MTTDIQPKTKTRIHRAKIDAHVKVREALKGKWEHFIRDTDGFREALEECLSIMADLDETIYTIMEEDTEKPVKAVPIPTMEAAYLDIMSVIDPEELQKKIAFVRSRQKAYLNECEDFYSAPLSEILLIDEVLQNVNKFHLTVETLTKQYEEAVENRIRFIEDCESAIEINDLSDFQLRRVTRR
jgi:hypothetical protein